MVKPTRERSLIAFPQEREKINEFNNLCRDYWKSLKYFILKLIGDPEEAEDKVSESFERFIPHLGRFKDPKEAVKYLFKIARNLSYDYLKEKRTQKDHLQYVELKGNLENLHDPGLESSMYEAIFQAQYYRSLVKEELENLTPQQQAVLRLVLENKTAEEIAAILDIAKNTVYQHHNAGLNRIKNNLTARGLFLLLFILLQVLTLFQKNNSVFSTTAYQKSSLYQRTER